MSTFWRTVAALTRNVEMNYFSSYVTQLRQRTTSSTHLKHVFSAQRARRAVSIVVQRPAPLGLTFKPSDFSTAADSVKDMQISSREVKQTRPGRQSSAAEPRPSTKRHTGCRICQSLLASRCLRLTADVSATQGGPWTAHAWCVHELPAHFPPRVSRVSSLGSYVIFYHQKHRPRHRVKIIQPEWALPIQFTSWRSKNGIWTGQQC